MASHHDGAAEVMHVLSQEAEAVFDPRDVQIFSADTFYPPLFQNHSTSGFIFLQQNFFQFALMMKPSAYRTRSILALRSGLMCSASVLAAPVRGAVHRRCPPTLANNVHRRLSLFAA